MRNFKIFVLTIAIASMLACTEGITQEDSFLTGKFDSRNDVETIEQMFQKSMQGVETTKFNEIVDPKNGMVQIRYPIPKSWKVNHKDSPIYIEGPGNLKVYKTETQKYAWSNSPMMQQTLQMGGQTLVQPLNNRQILNQWLRPNAEAQGYQFLKSYELPEVTGLWQRFLNAMPNTGSQRYVEALGTEWNTGRGTKSLIVMVRYQIVNQQTVLWHIQSTELETEPGAFEEAKNAYFYASANAEINPQWIKYMNGKLVGDIRKSQQFWANASAQSAAAHQQRMNAIAARGNAATSIGNTYSEILDISQKGYLNRSNINYSGHTNTIRSINETTLIGNHETGEHYSVPSGSRYYWVANDGTYFGTDNALLNPNTNNQMNQKNWTKFAVEH